MNRVQMWMAMPTFLALTIPVALEAGPSPSPAQMPLRAGPTLDQKLVVGDITISYPRGLESQAREVAEVCQTVVTARREQFLAMERRFADRSRTAKVLTQMLGCPESEQTTANLIMGMGETAALLEPMFTDVRLYREADLKASGGVSNGIVSLIYNVDTGKTEFTISRQSSRSGEAVPTQTEARAFLPVVVRDGGSFRAEPDLATFLGQVLDTFVTDMPLRLHVTAVRLDACLVLAQQCGGEPFTQWFWEGAAQWVTPRVIAEITPEYTEQCRHMILPEQPSAEARAKVNLLAWPFGEEARPRDAKDEESQYCAYELMDRLLREHPPARLATIVGRLKDQKPVDTEAILRALDATLGGDSRSLLLEYVPEAVRTGLQDGRPAELREEGYQALRDGEDSRAVQLFSDALEMTPSDADMRVNLAIAMRRSGIPKQGSERQIRLEAALAQAYGRDEFAVQGETADEACYVLGRIAQERGRADEAKAILSKRPKDHEDARRALEEIDEEKTASISAPGAVGGRPQKDQR